MLVQCKEGRPHAPLKEGVLRSRKVWGRERGHLNRVLPPSTLNRVCSFCGGCRSSGSLLNPSFYSRDLLAMALSPLRWQPGK